MDENKVLLERKDKIVAFLKEDKFLSAFIIAAAIAFIGGILSKIGTPWIVNLPAILWFSFCAFSLLSAGLVYYKKNKYAFYPILGWLVYLSVQIRTLNLSKLKDITTGGWTLGPDLDPFLFLRWAKYIVAHGHIMPLDSMRYVPIGFDTTKELLLHPYLMAWFHKFAAIFGSVSVEHSAVLYPVFMFALTVIVFFLLVRKTFIQSLGEIKSSLVALIASFFLIVIPSLLPRTIAGIPEKESAGFLFLFAALYFFVAAWQSEKTPARLINAILSGIATVAMAWIWGGYIFIYASIGIAVLISFFLGQIDLKKFSVFALWLAMPTLWLILIPTKYSLRDWITSPIMGLAYVAFLLIAVHFIIHKTSIQRYFSSGRLSTLPKPLISLIVTAVIAILLSSFIFGFDFIPSRIGIVKQSLVSPQADRIGVTVAENKQPSFSEWSENFDPTIGGIPITFWIFLAGAVYLFYSIAKPLHKKERLLMTGSFALFLLCLIFSRYSPSSILNGTNAISLFVYALGFIALGGSAVYCYWKYHKSNDLDRLKEIEFPILLIFSLLFLTLVGARGAVRLIMVLVPPQAMILGYAAVVFLSDSRKVLDSGVKFFAVCISILVILGTILAANHFYATSASTATNYAPTVYTAQWQQAMSWIRANVPQNAVFGHWWDYGYWLQSIGERATVLDGGNSIPYWDYLMGRYALTGKNNSEALNFLYSHNTTHFLIDSSDIGKYPAFSSIGSDENYDRYSWIVAFVKDSRQTIETKNSTMSVYMGGTSVDSDIIYDLNGTKVFLPEGKAGIGAVIMERNKDGNLIRQPEVVFIYSNIQYRLPMRYAFENGILHDFGSGLAAGVFVMPVIENYVDSTGAILYLSEKVVTNQFARLYLYNNKDPNFKLVHSEDDFAVSQVKQQNLTNSDFVYFPSYGGVRGPIKIWEIDYPSGMKVNPEYLQKEYPNVNLTVARK